MAITPLAEALPLPLRLALAFAAAFWAPGHALTLLLRRPFEPLERFALAVALSLVLLPIVGIVTSLALGFTPGRVALAYLVLNGALGVAAWRRGAAPAPAYEVRVPSARATLALSLVALTVSAALFALPLLSAREEPLSLAILGEDGRAEDYPVRLARGEEATVVLRVDAGSQERAGTLRATLLREGDASAEVVLLVDMRISVEAGEVHEFDITIPGMERGTYLLVVTWEGDETRRVHLWVAVGVRT